ncbi:Myosin-1 [Colletotrichum shisoi]|uniref:Myosin-1 n=1 Tax=Colletotrichum shisoi TaxID=2078593 RepID=A0A5Q4BWH8_9PEZI|nr:Myosin-1 [Colletotrichum shisoi]
MVSPAPPKKLDDLPDEILLRILSFLHPYDFPGLQLVCRRLQEISLDNNHWRSRTFDESPFLEAIRRRRRQASIVDDDVIDDPLLSAAAQLSHEHDDTEPSPHLHNGENREQRELQRYKDMANWDPSFPTELVFWYNEYIQRYAPVTTSWLQQPKIRDGNEEDTLDVRGMALYSPNRESNELLVVSPLDDGAVCLWDVKGTRGRKGATIATSQAGILYLDGPQTMGRSRKIDAGVSECISVDSFADKAFVAVQGHLLEVDLNRLQVVGEQTFEWSITALSSAAPGLPLTVGTSLGIHLYDYRARVRSPGETTDQIDVLAADMTSGLSARRSRIVFDDPLPPYAPLSQPTPLSILHLPRPCDEYSFSDDIYVAGRFSNILHYDRRTFPSIMGSIHSGARLASLASLPYPFSTVDSEMRRRSDLSAEQVAASKMREGGRTLIAGGEYNTKGSLELYGLCPRPGDSSADLMQSSTMKNRQTSSQSKILSVATQGTRIVFSDGSGLLKWFERDGFTEVRRHKIGHSEVSERPSLFASMPGSDDLARKILSTQTRNGLDNVNDDDVLFWTGEKLGLVGFSSKPGFTAEEFEESTPKSEREAKGISRRPKDKSAKTGPTGPSGAAGGGGKPKKATYEVTKKKEIGVSDLTLLSKVSNEAINDNLKKRFEGQEIYTYIGHVLVSVNPFRDLGIYTDQVLDSYKGKNRLEMPPHVFAIAESAYYNMKAYQDNQCVIISGESGAGKTEAAKRIMQYIANVSGGESGDIKQIKDMVLATNPLLESFGNAKTLRNNNSSRFGKYLQIHFNAQGEPVGADITNYLLEKSRVVGQIINERNFHIFYQFTKGASQTYRQQFGIQTPETYVYTSRSKCLEVEGIDDLAEYNDTLEAMKIIGLSQGEQDEIFRMLAAILWAGNIQFHEGDDGYAAVSDQSVVDFLAYLLEVTPEKLIKAITIRILTPRNGEVIESPTNPAQAAATRDALAKAIYSNLFDWIVERVNKSLKAKQATSNNVGILDIYGFEIFEKNSFEQLCINYVNEKLQQIFIQLTLKAEQDEYAREQIQWTPIKYFDNKIVCDLIESVRPPGVLSAMKDATKTAHADPAASDRTFMQSINGMSNPHLTPRQGSFIIKHYAGEVSYTVDGITDKNKDLLLKGLLNLFSGSSNQFVHALFPHQVDQDNRKQPPSAGDRIRASANALVETLMKCQPSYIRTIKPNENKSPSEYNVPNVLHQVKYLGLQENVRIRRAGFAYRQTFEKFVDRFFLLSPATSYAGEYTWQGSYQDAVKQILKDTSIPKEEWQMGTTKAFIKSPETLFALEHMRDRYWHNMATRIQRMWRAYLAYRAESATRIQRFWRKKRTGAEYLQLRDQGHRVLQNRKERRRYSLLGSRRFLGDYLGINASMGPGSQIRNAIDISHNEKVVFSCRGEILEAKFGRSSKPSPRILVVTSSKFYIVAQMLVNGQPQISVERSMPLGAIKFIAASTARDDWFSLGVGSPQEADPLLNCVLKTEMFTQMQRVMPGGFNLKIGEVIEYAKKPGKMQAVKVLKDSQQAVDYYKSGAVHTQPGEPPSSVSKPTPKGKPVAARPITRGKLIKPGGPNGRPSRMTNTNRTPQPRPAASPARTGPAATPQPPAAASSAKTGPIGRQQQQQPAAVATSIPTHTKPQAANSAATRMPPPPPPAAPPAKNKIMAKVLYDFAGQKENELTVRAGDMIEIVQKENNGWWLAKNGGSQAWVPAAYVEEQAPARVVAPRPPPPPPSANGVAARGKPTPPQPPVKRPAAGRKPAVAQPRDSGLSLNGASGSDNSRSNTPTLGNSLADALLARKNAMQKKDDDDDW